jgi:uncharacterized membrane protein
MIMTPRIRKLALTLHITASVGWFGVVVGFLALVIAALATRDAQIVRTVYIAIEIIGWYAIVPLAFASLISGLIMSLGTKWGLFRHYWVIFKLLLTIVATLILMLNMKTVSFLANAAEKGSVDLIGLWGELGHAGGGLLVLMVTIILSVYKPRGLTRYGQRKQNEQA